MSGTAALRPETGAVTAGLHYNRRYGRETGERDLRPQQHPPPCMRRT